MVVYFVRHGQSILNAKHRPQFPHTPLSELGLQQAQAVAARLQAIHVDALWSSPMTRALQTAQAIGAVKKLAPQIYEDLAELRRPSEVQGRAMDDPIVVAYHAAMKVHLYDDDWKQADAESFAETHARAWRMVQLMQQFEGESLVVVSHGLFIVHMLCAMMFGEHLAKRTFIPIVSFTNLSNTGLTVCEWNGPKSSNHWRLQQLNDDAHLGEVTSTLRGKSVGLGV